MLLWLALACAPEPVFEMTLTVSDEVETVVTTRFTVDQDLDETPWVRFGAEGDATGWTVQATEVDGAYEALLVGVRPDTVLWAVPGIGEHEGEEGTTTTGELPDWVGEPAATEGDPTPGFHVTCIVGAEQGPVIFDSAGYPVWAWTPPDEVAGMLSTRARLTPDQDALVFNNFLLEQPGDDNDGIGALVEVALDGSSYTLIDAPYNHHDFDLLDDGTLVWLDADEREVEGFGTLRGDRIVERAPDGTETAYGSTWDYFPAAAEAPEEDPSSWWSLANHLEVHDDVVVFSSRNVDLITVIERGTGELLDVIGTGDDATIVLDDPTDGQHGFDWAENELLVFDNDLGDSTSRVVRYDLDTESGTLLWEYKPGYTAIVLGDAIQLDNERVLVAVATSSLVQEVDDSGEVLAEYTQGSGMVTFIEWREQIGVAVSPE